MTNDETILHIHEYFNGTITAYVSKDYRYRNRNPAPEGGIMDATPKDFVKWVTEFKNEAKK